MPFSNDLDKWASDEKDGKDEKDKGWSTGWIVMIIVAIIVIIIIAVCVWYLFYYSAADPSKKECETKNETGMVDSIKNGKDVIEPKCGSTYVGINEYRQMQGVGVSKNSTSLDVAGKGNTGSYVYVADF